MTKRLLLAIAFGGSLLLNAQVSVGIQIGAPPPPRVIRVRPLAPGPGYVWLDGYWYVQGHHYRWHDGYWTRPPYAGAIWVAPRHDGRMFYSGYWQAGERRWEHDHRWDRDRRVRDYDRH